MAQYQQRRQAIDANVRSICNQIRQYHDTDAVVRHVVNLLVQCPSLPAITDANRVCLSGTLPIYHSGHTYNIPIKVWLEYNFPYSAPRIKVVPTSDMVVKDNHPHVRQSNGEVFHQSLHAWHPQRSELALVMNALATEFGDNPPVYAKVVKAAQPQAGQAGPAPGGAQRQPPPAYPGDPEALAREVKISQIAKVIKDDVRDLLQQTEARKRKAEDMKRELETRSNDVDRRLTQLRSQKDQMEADLQSKRTLIEETEQWLAEHPEGTNGVEDLIMPEDRLTQQLIEEVAQDHACEDTMAMLKEAFEEGKIDLEHYIANLRTVAKDQYKHKLLANRIKERRDHILSPQ